jgi:hypothetical protein
MLGLNANRYIINILNFCIDKINICSIMHII